MTKLLAAALLTVASTASAQVVVATEGYARPPAPGSPAPAGHPLAVDDSGPPEPYRPPTPREVDARLGMVLGGADVGDADGFSIGASAGLGYRIGDLTLRGLFDYYKVGDGDGEALQRKGRAMRVGAAVRYSFANNGLDREGFLADFWGELGAGYEHVSWRQGGVLDRPNGEIAIGVDLGHRGDENARGDRKKIGYFMAFRSFVAQGPEMNGVMETCGGPCNASTTPSRMDLTMFFEFGVHWGR